MTYPQIIDLYWTSGRDSTFRLLQLVLLERRPVMLHYIIDHHRHARRIEIRTMRRILAAFREHDPGAAALVRGVVHTRLKEVPDSPAHLEQYESLRAKTRTGRQYYWLACYADQHPGKELEVCFVKPGHARHGVGSLLAGQVRGTGHECRLVECSGVAGLELFRAFRFPVIHLTKIDMTRIADEHGFRSLLEMAWFCLSTSVAGIPCGTCLPCSLVMKEGLRYVMPVVSQLLYYNRYHRQEDLGPFLDFVREAVRSRRNVAA